MEIEFSYSYFVYIFTNDQGTHFNVDITTNLRDLLASDIAGRSFQLLYYEQYQDKLSAVKRETELAFLSQRKLKRLILNTNPQLEAITAPVLSS